MNDKKMLKNGKYQDAFGVYYFKDGKLHCNADLPSVEKFHDNECWLKCWHQHGLLHRENGAAQEYSDGRKEWWIHGIRYTEKEFQLFLEKKKLKKSLHKDLNNKSAQSKVKI